MTKSQINYIINNLFTFLSKRRRTKIGGHLTVALIAFGLLLCGFLASFLSSLLKSGPILERDRLHLPQNIQILDRKGGVLYQFTNDQNRVFIPNEQIPDVMKKAIVAIEDERFLTRTPCIDVRSVLRALFVNMLTSERSQGASTLTQQLVRTLYLQPGKTLERKFYEVVFSCRLESTLSKEEILTLYLNGVTFGNGTYGVEQASQMYFGMPASKLSLAEAAILASIPQRPTYYSPYGAHLRASLSHADIADVRSSGVGIDPADIIPGLLPRLVGVGSGSFRIPGRADAVINAMERLEFVDHTQAEHARQQLLFQQFKPRAYPIAAPHFSLWMRSEAEALLSTVSSPDRWRTAGLRVRTTLDPALQFIAEDTLESLKPLLEKKQAKNAALVAIDRRTRDVVAYVGNVDFFEKDDGSAIDMAQVPRQPGSSIKPLVYAAAMEHGYTPDTEVLDEPIRIGSDIPKNYDGGFLGPITVREALGHSRNIPAIKAFLDAGGEDAMLRLMDAVGMATPRRVRDDEQKKRPDFTYGWPMAIGSVEVPLIEMVQMYAVIANHGVFEPLTYFCGLADQDGALRTPFFDLPPSQVLQKQAADGVDNILRDPESKPQGFWRKILTIPGMDIAAKTGTSNLCLERDVYGRCVHYGVNNVWTIGYGPKLVVGVWVGNADASAMDDLADGLTVAAPVWHKFLERAESAYEGGDVCTEDLTK